MLLPIFVCFFVADLIAIILGRCYCLWLLTCGGCCYHIGVFNNSCWDLADVIANAFFFVADLIAIICVLADVIANAFFFVADLIAIICVLADVIAIYVEDGKPHFLCLCFWQMLLPWWQM